MECPVCFESHEDLVAGSCGHGLCLECADTLLLKGQSRRLDTPSTGVEALPTLGQCPLCREELLYFDLKFIKSQENAFCGDQIDENLSDTAYVGELGVGWTSLHLLEGGDANNSYIQGPDNRQMKLTDLRYHDQSHTLQFQIMTSERDQGNRGIVCFSDNFSFISRGVLRRLNAIQVSKIDGVWKRPDIGLDAIVFNQQCMVLGASTESSYCLGVIRCEGDKISMLLRSQDRSTEENAIETWDAHLDLDQDLILRPGTTLRWKRSGSDSVIEDWKFDRALPPESTATIPISGKNGELYWRLGLSEPQPPLYNATSLEGNVFVQSGSMGEASYHIDPDQPYISYENAYAVTQWPPLDNGRPIPSKMYFTHVQTEGTHFRGVIDWIGTYGTTWNHARRWIYEIHFDDQFHCVLSGTVRYEQDIDRHGQSEFGKDLVYINAALLSSETCRANLDFRRLQRQEASPQTLAEIRHFSRKPRKPPSYFR